MTTIELEWERLFKIIRSAPLRYKFNKHLDAVYQIGFPKYTADPSDPKSPFRAVFAVTENDDMTLSNDHSHVYCHIPGLYQYLKEKGE